MTSPLGTGVVSTFPVNAGLAPNVDALLVWGYRWGNGPVGAPATVTYSFPAAGATWISDYWESEPFIGFSAFNAAQQTAAKQALAAWSEVANISFVQVADTPTNVGDIRFANSDVVAQAEASAWAYFPYETPSFAYPEAGDVWVNAKYSPNFQLQPGQFGCSTMIHEIGHAIGLDHPFIDRPGDIPLPPNLDNESYTIMSYTINDTTLAYASSPMLFDILAIQYIYGANMTTRTGNDVYQYSASVEVQKTIWDAGGIDTLDFSNQTRASTIDLHAGTFTRFGGTTPTTSSLIAIAYGVTIENAIGSSAGDNIVGNDADNMLDGRGGADAMYGGAGNDIYVIDNVGDVVDEGANSDTGDELRSANILLSQRYAIENYTYTGAAAWNFTSQAGENNRLTGGSGIDTLNSSDGNDTLLGNSGNDYLLGVTGDDYLDGGIGLDKLKGGAGNDVYVVDNAGDIIDEGGNVDANDEARATISINLTTLGAGFIEHGMLLGTAALNVTGSAVANTLTGNDGANVLDGLVGADAMHGGKGNDTYVVDNIGDKTIETVAGSAGGIDLVRSSISFSLAPFANVENLTLLGTAGLNATGNGLGNVLTGNDGANRLDGLGGNDTLVGGKGDDTYVVDSTSDVVSETLSNSVGGGIDTVESSATFSLAASGNVDHLTLTGGGAVNGTGNALGNTIRGNAAANVLDGGAGADILRGGAGDDTYVLDNAGDILDEEGNADLNDQVKASFLIASSLAGIEHYTYTGGAAWSFAAAAGADNKISGGSANDTLNGGDGKDILLGNAGNDYLLGVTGDDYLDGGIGLDKLKGGAGNDVYIIDNAGDTVDEGGNVDANDEARATISINLTTLGAGFIEHGTLLGTAALNVTGSAVANTLTGNDGANILDGLGGADALAGGKGNDTYVVDNAGDQVIETIAGAAGGIDLVRSSISFSLAPFANVENLTLTGKSAIDATGNSLGNVLTGNDGANRLDGLGGNDTLIGGLGDDIYVVDSVSDVVSETAAAGGVDTVESSATFSLAASGNVEHLTLTGGGAINGTGNALVNIIRGNAASNVLDGGTGADVLRGGAGDDTYVLDNAGDVVDEEGNADLNDQVKTGILIASGLVGIEHYTYTGGAAWSFAAVAGADNKISGGSANDTLNGGDGNDTLLGNAGNDYLLGVTGDDYLDGGLGLDKLKGGAGNDVYVIDNAGDTIDEGGNVDTGDEARATISINLTTLGAGFIEHATLLGTAALNLTGNGSANNLTGNDGANILDGLGGADTLAGGKGNDTYIVDNAGDQVIETIAGASVGGIDLVQSSVSFSLAPFGNVENLTLTGKSAIDGTGNGLGNVLIGNDGANRLDGLGGADMLIGGLGDDVYVVDSASDVVSETVLNSAGGGADKVESSITFSLAALGNVEHLTLTGGGAISATGNALVNIIRGNGAANTLDGGVGADILRGGAGDDLYLLDNVGDVADEESNTDVNDRVKTSVLLAAAFSGVEHYSYTGTAAWTFIGTSENNEISGGTGNDTLNGDGGNDNLLGNNGSDTLIGGIGDDWLDGGAGADKLRGGAGDDTYVIDDAGDTIDEEGNNDANDVVRATVSINLVNIGGDKIENAVLLGALAINATGNDQVNTLIGNDAANILDGGASADVLIGGKGNDTYVVDNAGDQVIESADGGADTVQAAFSLAVASFTNIENLTLTGSGNIDATGDGGINVLTGNEGNNILDGGGGPDTLIGGKGDDTYIVGGSEDAVVESISNALGGGVDTVITVFDYSIANNANVDNITITGSTFGFIHATGNAGANILTGGSGLDNLSGGDGDDRLIGNQNGDHLIGGIGNDYFLGGEGQDSIWTNAGRDVIDLDAWSDRGDTIYDFTVGSGGDVLDLHDLLVDIGYVGSDPFADGYLSFSSGGIGTSVNVDTDGNGTAVSFSITVATLLSVTLTQADTDNYIV